MPDKNVPMANNVSQFVRLSHTESVCIEVFQSDSIARRVLESHELDSVFTSGNSQLFDYLVRFMKLLTRFVFCFELVRALIMLHKSLV